MDHYYSGHHSNAGSNAQPMNEEKLRKAISKKTKWLILNSPSNPTGASYTKTEIKKLRKKIRELQDNKGFMLAQLELTTSSANQALVAKLKPTISATLARIKRTFERQK